MWSRIKTFVGVKSKSGTAAQNGVDDSKGILIPHKRGGTVIPTESGEIQALDLCYRSIGKQGAEAIARLLQHDCCKNIKVIRLYENNIDDEGLELILNAIATAQLSELKTLSLADNKIKDRGAKAVANLISNVQFKHRLTISLSENKIGDKGMSSIVDALLHPACHDRLTLQMRGTNITSRGAIILRNALSSGNCKKGLKLKIKYNQKVDDDLANDIEILCNKNRELLIPTSFGEVPVSICSGNRVRIELQDLSIGVEGARILATALEMDCYKNINHLDLENTKLGDEGLILILNALQKSISKKISYLCLDDNNIGVNGVTALARAIESGIFMDGKDDYLNITKIVLNGNNFGDEGAKELAKAFMHPACPNNLKVSMNGCKVTDEGVRIFGEAYKSGLCKKILKIGLINNQNVSRKEFSQMLELQLKNEASYYARNCLVLYQGLQQQESPVSMLPLDVMPIICSYVLPELSGCHYSLYNKYKPKNDVFARNVHAFYKDHRRKPIGQQEELDISEEADKTVQSRLSGPN